MVAKGKIKADRKCGNQEKDNKFSGTKKRKLVSRLYNEEDIVKYFVEKFREMKGKDMY